MKILTINQLCALLDCSRSFLETALHRSEFTKYEVPFRKPRSYKVTKQFAEELAATLEPKVYKVNIPYKIKAGVHNNFKILQKEAGEYTEKSSYDINILQEFCNDPRCVVDFNLVFPMWNEENKKMQFTGILRRDICEAVKDIILKHQGQ